MAVTNLHQFQIGLQKFAERGEKRGRDRVKAVALEGLKGVVLGTRVDTGRARGNWQTTEGQPATGTVDRADQAGSEGTVDTVAEESRKVLNVSGTEMIWLHNGVPYAGELERKDKMVAGTVERLKTWLRST